MNDDTKFKDFSRYYDLRTQQAAFKNGEEGWALTPEYRLLQILDLENKYPDFNQAYDIIKDFNKRVDDSVRAARQRKLHTLEFNRPAILRRIL